MKQSAMQELLEEIILEREKSISVEFREALDFVITAIKKDYIEQPEQETTLEEVANEYAKNRYSPEQGFPEEDYYISFLSFRAGAKWQQEQNKKCYHPLPYRLAKSDVNYECTLCGKFI